MPQPLLTHLAWAASLLLATLAAQAQTAIKPAEPTPDDTVYIVTRPDFRKCAFPYCGGYYVKAVNQLRTRCADGTLQKDCHVVQLDARALGWSDDQRATFDGGFAQGQALVRGRLAQQPVLSVTANTLVVSEAWQGQAASTPKGTFYAVKSTGIVCITAPCPSLGATRLNSAGARTFNPDLDLTQAGADEAAQLAAGEALGTTGILAAGTLVPVSYPTLTGGTRWGVKLVASEFYLPARP